MKFFHLLAASLLLFACSNPPKEKKEEEFVFEGPIRPLAYDTDSSDASKEHSYELYRWKKDETLRDFTERLLPDSCELDDATIIDTKWNGRHILVATHRQFDPDTSYQEYEHSYFTVPVLYVETEASTYRRLSIDNYGPEGGNAVVESIFFANADDDAEKELLVIVSWYHKHYDVEGYSFQTYVYDDKLPSTEGTLAELKSVSNKLDGGCNCSWRDGKEEKAKYTTAAEVKKRLKEWGL